MTTAAARFTLECGRKRPQPVPVAKLARAAFMAAVAVLSVQYMASASDGDPPSMPDFAEVKKTVERYLDSIEEYRPGDLIFREQIGPLFARIEAIGWKVDNRTEIEARLVSEQSFLGKSLSTKAGRKFMRQVTRYPYAFDRLEHMANLPQGQRTIRDLIRGPDGYKMIEYMTTSPGGKELGRMLSNTPRGKGFNAPTERVYTADDLVASLKSSHESAVAASASR